LSVIKKINGKLQKKEGLQKLQKQILMYVSRGCTKLHLTDEIAKRARKIIAKYRPVLGQKPAIIAATALVLAINSCVVDPPLSVSHIASALDVSTSTVCSYYHSFRVRPNSIRYRTTQL
jgi:transcription initiation factor TFIIIB Brf1 subunit/transcription initiation factor TFIIB